MKNAIIILVLFLTVGMANADEKIKNPPPEGVVLGLPLKGDKFASCPQRGRG